jgi:hypothetical protein
LEWRALSSVASCTHFRTNRPCSVWQQSRLWTSARAEFSPHLASDHWLRRHDGFTDSNIITSLLIRSFWIPRTLWPVAQFQAPSLRVEIVVSWSWKAFIFVHFYIQGPSWL